MKPHKHAELIKAWADGAEIEAKLVEKRKETAWELCLDPWWNDPAFEYRIKPEQKPDVVVYVTFAQGELEKMVKESEKYAQISEVYFSTNLDDTDKLKLTFDGETGELKSAEVLK